MGFAYDLLPGRVPGRWAVTTQHTARMARIRMTAAKPRVMGRRQDAIDRTKGSVAASWSRRHFGRSTSGLPGLERLWWCAAARRARLNSYTGRRKCAYSCHGRVGLAGVLSGQHDYCHGPRTRPSAANGAIEFSPATPALAPRPGGETTRAAPSPRSHFSPESHQQKQRLSIQAPVHIVSSKHVHESPFGILHAFN
jgi:hypothetical protein